MVGPLSHTWVYADEMIQDGRWSRQKEQPKCLEGWSAESCDTSPTSWEETIARDGVKSHCWWFNQPCLQNRTLKKKNFKKAFFDAHMSFLVLVHLTSVCQEANAFWGHRSFMFGTLSDPTPISFFCILYNKTITISIAFSWFLWPFLAKFEPARVVEIPEFVASWSEVQVAWEHCSLWLVSSEG